MELYQLEAFIAVVEERSFTRAAERVHRTQTAVSVAIRRLEEDIGVAVLSRDSRDCTLTDPGRVLLRYARRIIDARDHLQQRLAEFTELAAGRVRIAAHESAAQYLLPAPLAAFHALHPMIKIITRLCDVDQVARLVATREVDLGFGIRQLSLDRLESEVILSDPLVVVAAPDHRLAALHTVRIDDVSAEPFFAHHLQTATSAAIRELFEQHHATLNVVAELWNFETVKQFVRAGCGIAILPLSVARSDLEAGRLRVVPVPELRITRSIEAVHRQGEQLLPAAARLLEILRRYDWVSPLAVADITPSERPYTLSSSGQT